ncbi:MAG: N-acetylmuramoyl-L-alanine amidase [Tissierellia bacterium]|nr:N-acetylmuramoyl-L-alanine amidase [Tissierellia bacterium]
MNIKYFDNIKKREMEMPLEKMVKLLLALEIDNSFHIETLKAQAIIIRTNLLRMPKFLGGKEIINLNINSLEFCKNENKIHKACEETKGIVILFEGKPIDAKYHICCGGSTENAENVLGNPISYLRRVLCNHCEDSPYLNGEKIFTIKELEEKLKTKFHKIEEDIGTEVLDIIDNIKRDKQGRVISIKIGNRNFKGYELMESLDLNSTRFKIYPENIKFISKGYGHGLGFCQYGGENMAQLGKNYEEILKYYYTGVEVKEFPLPCIKKPIYGKVIVIDPGHGGEDKGHKGVSLGLEEKNLTMKLAQILKSKLKDKGAIVYLTREKDENILIANRIEKANEIQPNFFLSIHLDYYPNSTKKGLEIFYFKEDREAKALGNLILKNLKENLIPTRGIKEGNFYVFRGVKASSLLMEIGYLSNIEEEIKLSQEKYLIKIANSIEKGFLEYFVN